MITLKDFMQLVDYRITEGSDYGWQCYGPNAYQLDSWNGDHNGYSFTITFDTKTQTVFEVQAHDYTNQRAYRLISSFYVKKHQEESQDRTVDIDQAWDDVDYITLETPGDFMEKAQAIVNGEDYDTRIEIPLTLDDEQVFDLMKMAHEQDITLNQLVEDVLREQMRLHETGTDNPVDFPVTAKKKKKKK